MPDPWDSKTVIGLFCDPYVASTNLEGGHSEDTLQDVSGWLSELKKYDNISSKAKTVIDEATELFAEGARLGRAGFGPQWCQDLKHRLEKLKPGQLFLAPGGWRNPKGGHAIIYLFQCMSDSEFRFAVCNTGEGVNAHPEDAGADVFPKEKRLTSWLLKGIPREQILDELWLYSLFKIYYRQGDHHKPNMLYEFLLPMLCPSGDVRKETDASWSTSATCQRAGSCYYKCCPAALRLILGIRGVEEQQRKLVFYYMRLGQLSRIHQALNDTELEAMTESDFMVVECACRQMGQKVLYQKTISSAEKESARGLISDVDGKVAEAREIQRKALASKAVGISEGVPEDFVGYCGFPGWELLSVPWFGHGNKLAYEHLMGHKDSLSPGQHVDIAALRELNGYNLLFETYKVCDKLENNGFEEISKLRIGSIIEDVMLRQFPPGHADWNEDFDMHTQGLVLKALWRLTQHYVTAVASSTTSRTQVAAQILTMRSLHAAFETVLRRAATDGMLPTTQAIICPHGGDDTDSYRSPWSFTGEADFEGKSAAGATEGLPLSTPKLAEVRDRLARHPAGEASKGDSAWDRSLNGLKYRAEALKPTQELVKDLTRKVLRIMSNVLPPNHSDEWPKWTVPFGWALNSTGEIKTKAPEFYMWRDICVWARYLCLDPQCRKFKGVFKADAATITWRVGYCKPCEILKAQASGLLGNVKFDQLEKGFTTTSGASLSSAGLKNALSEDDVIHAPTLPTFGQALAQEEAEHVLSALTMPYLRIPLLLHFLAADRLHALKQTTMQEMLWAALLEPAVWGDDESPKPVENAPELRGKLGTSFGLLHNEVIHGLSSIAAPFCALCAQAEELAGLAPPEEFDGPPAVILQFFVRLCSRVLDQLHNQNVENAPDLMRTLKVFLEEKAVKHLKRWIDAASQEMDTRCRLHAHLALTCLQRDVSDPENLILLLSSSSYVMAWYERDFSDTFGTELQMVFEVVQRRRVEVINAVKDSPKRKYVLDEAAKITSNFFTSHSDEWNPGDGPGSWKCDKKGGAAVFNLQTCTLWLESGLLRPIPPKLQRTPHFVEFFRMHPVKLQPTCRPVRLSRNCHILSAVDDDSITFEMQWWSSQSQQSDQVSPEDDEGFKWRANGSCKAVACAWKSGEWTWNLPGGMSFELSDVPHWLKSNGKTELAEVWERLLTWAQDPGNDDEGEDLAPLMGTWFCQTSHFEAKELVAVQYLDRQGVLEARFACEGHPVIRIFTHHDFGRHSFRSQVFCSDVAFSYASLVPNDGDREERPLCNPQFAGKIGFLPKDETLAIFDDGKRLWVPPVALQGLLPAALLEGCRFWAKEEHGVVSFKGEPYNPPVYNSLNYTMQVTCENGIAKVTRKVGDKIWVLASPIHAPRGSQIERFAEILGPLEAMSHALFWTNEDGTEVCLVELPRVQLRFVPGPDPNGRGLRLFSKEFGGFYLLNRRGVYDPEAWKEATGDPRAMDLAKFLAKMPHAVILRSASGAIRILVTSADVKRPNIKCKPFSTDLVVNRKILVALSGKTFLWDFHESGSLLLTSSLSGTLYLSLLTLLHRDYTSSARLIGSVGFDEGISAEEFRLLKMMLTLTVKDRHPDASALRLKLILALIAHNPKHPLLEPDNKLIGSDYYDYLIKLTHISQSCQLQLREEGVLLRNMQEMECEMWPQAVNRFKFVEAALNESPACVLRSSVDHPAANREGMLGYEILSRRMDAFCNNLWYENFSVDMKDAGKNRSDLESLTEFLDRCDREDWTCSGTLFFSLYAHLTGVSTATLNGKDVTKRLVRLAIERYWLRCVRLSKNPSGDDIRAICTLWSVLGMNAMGMSHNLPPWEDAAKLHKESKYGCMIGHDETCGRTFLNALHEALKSGYSCAESLVPKVIAQPSSQQEKLTISEEAMPKFAPPCAPRLTDFAKGSCGLEDEEDEVLSMLSIPLKSISERFMSTFEETLNVPENPFSQERLAGLPGGMTRMGAAIIKGKLDGHAVFLERARKKKGFSLSCLSKPDDSILGDCLDTLDELETEIKGCWSHDLEKVISLRTELLKKADLAPKDGGGEGTRFWLARRGGIEGHVWLEWCIGSELDNVREFTGCVEAVNKVVDKGAARDVGRGILGLMLHVNRVAQAQLVLGCVQDLRGAVKRAQRKGIDEVVWKELQTLAGRVAMFLGCRRNYTTSSPEISPAFLLFEYVTGFMVRKQQVDLIRRFAEEAFAGRSLVAQMIMGAGKTTCIAPMLTLLLGNDGRLVLNIVPRALLAQTRNVMRTMFGQILAKRVVTLEFSRMMGQDDPFDVKLVKMQLFDAQRDAAVVCTTPAAIKSMFLRHLELLQMNHILSGTMENFKKQLTKATDSVSQTRVKRRLDDVNKEMTGNRVMAGFIGEVLGMLRNNSCALIDEVDLVLHPLKSELNFPIGSFEMYDLGCERWHLAVHLLDALFLNDEGHAAAGIYYPEIRNCSGKGQAAAQRISELEQEIPEIVKKGYDLLTLQKQPHLVLLSRAFYDKNLLRPLADWLACWIVTRTEAKKFREGVELKDVCEFLSMDLADLLKSDVKTKVQSQADGTIGKLLCLGREWLFQLIPHVLSKVNRVQYGLLTERELSLVENQKAPSSRRLLAVPFIAKDKPSPAAEFAQPDVLIGFTVLAYRYEGMRLSDTVSMLHHLQMKSGRESGPWGSRPTCVLFERWKDIGAKRYKEKGGKSSVGGLGPLNWEVNLNDGWKKLPNNITELLREAVAKKETKVKFTGFGAQPYEIDLEKMVQTNLKSKKARDIRQMEESDKRGEDLKLPELQALSSSTGDEEDKKKKQKAKEEKDSGGAEAETDPLLKGRDAVQEKPEGHAQVAVELLGPVPEIVLWYLLTMVFDAVLRQQPHKLSATGQELGSSMLFSSRIGFSGTPSSLLPEDLGECLFEAENEGEILSVLSDEQHVVPPLINLASDWSPESILNMVAKSSDPVYHCLIDTGALVMGFTNEEVAKLLLKLLPEELFDGVAYFDDRDAPMVILRGAVKPALLSEAGVPMDRRFTFFDQVHTTGTDTKQPLQSYAALTLSASMTFRDYAQGAWRMRGLGKGQKLRMVIAPELAKKVQGIVKVEGELGLHDAVAFMLSNQFDSEGKQFAALQLQNLATVWRQHALNDLMEKEVKVRESKDMRPQVESFLESLRFPVESKVHQPLTLDQKMQGLTDEQAHIMNDDEKAHCAKLIGDASGGGDGGDLGAEITRQQEKEQEKQQEKEKEVEVHVGREREREVEWPLEILEKETKPEESGVFFQLAKFQMAGLKTKLKCTGNALVSSNHTANALTTMNVRRMKSVIIMLVVGPKTMAVSMAEAAALRRAKHLESEHLPSNSNLWICSGCKKVPESSLNLFAKDNVVVEPDSGEKMADPSTRARRLEAARCLLRFFNCDLDFRPDEVTSAVKALESGCQPKQRQHFVETVLGARRREACSWRDTPLGEIVRGDSAKLEERARLVQNLYGLMKDRFKSAGDFFKVLDVNGDGVLQHEEFQRSMKKVFKGTFSPEDVRKLFNAADTSGRGNVTLQDLRQLLQSGAAATGGVIADESPEADDPGSPTSPTADEPEDPDPGIHPASTGGDPNPDVSPSGPIADTTSVLWTVPPEAIQREIEEVLRRVNAGGSLRQRIINSMSGMLGKDQAGFLSTLRMLAGLDQEDIPETKSLIREVEDAGRDLESEHDIYAFQLMVLANLLDDKVLQSELEDLYVAAEGEDGNGLPMPPCLVTVDKYLAKALDMWNTYPEKWSTMSQIECSEEKLKEVIANARSLSSSSNAQMLALAKCHTAELSIVAKTDAAELCLEQLTGVVQKYLKGAKDGKEEEVHQVYHTMLEWGVFLVANLVQKERAATIPKLKGPLFQEAAGFVWDKKQDDVKILAALSYVLQALSMNITKWQVEMHEGEWSDMAAEQQLALRTAASKGETVLHFRARGFPYEIDIKAMTQTNLKSGTSRKIKEVDVTSFAAGGEEAEEEKPYKWQVSNGKGGWWDFPPDVDTKVKEAKGAGLTIVTCSIRGQPYEVDLNKMHQKNTKTGTKREIRMCPI